MAKAPPSLGLALTLVRGGELGAGQPGRASEAGKVNMLAYVVWASLFSVPPLLSSVAVGAKAGPPLPRGSPTPAWRTWAVVLWQSVGNTMFGYACLGLAAGALIPPPPYRPCRCWCRCSASRRRR